MIECLGDRLVPVWWRTAEQITAEVEAHGTITAAARAHGVAASTVRSGWSALGLPPLPKSRAKIELPEGMSAPVSELERVRQENAELRRYVKRDREGDIAEARVIDALLAAIPAASPRYRPPTAKTSKRDPHSMAVLFSDVHASEIVRAEETLGINSYDWDIMLKRMARMQGSILAHQEHLAAPVDELNVWILGDQLSGDIHDELARTNDRPTAQAAVDFGYETARWLEEFVPHFKRINVVGVPGNHPRFTVKPANKQAHNNADWISYQVTQAILREHPSFTWHFPRAAYATTMIAKRWHVLLLHGDGIRTTMPGVPWGGVVRRITSLEQQFNKAKKPIDYFCVPTDTSEILTRRGWLRHDEVAVGDETLGLTGDGVLSWSRINDIHHPGVQEVTRFGNAFWSAECTSNHRWATTDGMLSVEEMMAPSAAKQARGGRPVRERKRNLVLAAPLYEEPVNPISPHDAAILGWVITDGWSNRYSTQIYQSKSAGQQDIEELLKDVPHSQRTRSDGLITYFLRQKWAKPFWDRVGHDPVAAVLRMGPIARCRFLMSAWLAEGHVRDNQRIALGQNKGATLDAITLATYLSGDVPLVKGSSKLQRLCPMTRPVAGKRLLAHTPRDTEVWCVTTGLGTFTMRQGQQVSLTGNCLGHFHAANALDGIGSKVFMNGSLKGVDEFSLKQFGSGHHPSQLLLTFHEKHGITGTQYLDLEDVEPAGIAA